ncbi:hypothetical protein OJJOAM_000329 [Cupriavidus sp. H18C1]
MLGVLALAAPMVFGETWHSLFARKPRRHAAAADASDEAMPAASRPVREASMPAPVATRWTPVGDDSARRPTARHKGIEAVSARRAPAWQPPPRTRVSPPQPGEIWLHSRQPARAAQSAKSAHSAHSAQPTPSAPTPPAQRAAPARTAGSAPSAPSAPSVRPAPAAPSRPAGVAAPAVTASTASSAAASASAASAASRGQLRATVVASPFHQPQLGLRSAITTLPEAQPQARPAGAAPLHGAVAAPSSVAPPAGAGHHLANRCRRRAKRCRCCFKCCRCRSPGCRTGPPRRPTLLQPSPSSPTHNRPRPTRRSAPRRRPCWPNCAPWPARRKDSR